MSDLTDRLRAASVEYTFVEGAILTEAADRIEHLEQWKAEALTVLAEWENVWEAAGKPGPLGSSKALATMYHIEQARNEIAELHVDKYDLRKGRYD